jgi:hypothetical protein
MACAKGAEDEAAHDCGNPRFQYGPAGTWFASAEVAGPGSSISGFRQDGMPTCCPPSRRRAPTMPFGRAVGRKIMVEFVSANPTGPHAHGECPGRRSGDTLSEVLARWRGYLA